MLHIGVDIGGTKTAIGVFDGDFSMISFSSFPSRQGDTPERILSVLAEEIKKLAPKNVDKIGMGIPGVVNPKTGRICLAPNLKMLEDFPIRDYLQERFPHSDIRLDNDANAAALAEYTLGAGQGHENMIYSTISTGIGGGVIIGGKLHRGAHFAAGEIGHMLLIPGGELCGCGNRGCAEAYAGGANYPAQIKKRLEAGEKSLLSDYETINGEALSAAYFAGDKLAAEFFDRITWALGTLYFNLYRALDVDLFVLGGGLTNVGEPLFRAIRRHFESWRHDYEQVDFPVDFVPARFKSSEVGVIGAALL